MKWYIHVLKNFSNFSGRSRRTEFWMFALINLIIIMLLSLVDKALGLTFGLAQLYNLIVLIPSIAVGIRRLHDTDRSGWWLLINFIPIIGWIVLLVFFVMKGTEGANRFGNDPKREPEPV